MNSGHEISHAAFGFAQFGDVGYIPDSYRVVNAIVQSLRLIKFGKLSDSFEPTPFRCVRRVVHFKLAYLTSLALSAVLFSRH